MKNIVLIKGSNGNLQVHFHIVGLPSELACGDTFELSIFENFGGVTVKHIHWRPSRDDRIIECEGSKILLKPLVSLKFAHSGVDSYELPHQEWK